MKKNYSPDLGILTALEMIEMLQSLSPKYCDWPIGCCDSGESYPKIINNIAGFPESKSVIRIYWMATLDFVNIWMYNLA